LTHLLNLLAAIALLVWGTHLVRTGALRVAGANLRQVRPRASATGSMRWSPDSEEMASGSLQTHLAGINRASQ
jgi:hypothetical protein